MFNKYQKKKTIFIIDDYRQIRALLSDEFSDMGYRTVTCENAAFARDMISKTKPDLIVMEISLGNCNGLDLLQDIRNTNYNLPVILWTASQDYKYDIRALAADYYVLKRVDIDELKKKVRMAIEGSDSCPPACGALQSGGRILNNLSTQMI